MTAEYSVAPSGVDLQLYYKPGWTAAQRAAAAEKAAALTDAETFVVQSPQRAGTSAAARYRQAGNSIPAGSDVDHLIDLQLGGADNIMNMNPLDASVNRSFGAQIQQRIQNLPPGTPVNRVNIGDRP
jgi:filamentous hemagglutinin